MACGTGFMNKPVEDPEVQTIWLQVYKNFIEAVDAVDNGINQYEDVSAPRYFENTSLSKRVGALNPEWNEPSGSEAIDARFADAVALTGKEFDGAVRHAVSSWLPARSIVAAALEAATTVHKSGVLCCPLPSAYSWQLLPPCDRVAGLLPRVALSRFRCIHVLPIPASELPLSLIHI